MIKIVVVECELCRIETSGRASDRKTKFVERRSSFIPGMLHLALTFACLRDSST